MTVTPDELRDWAIALDVGGPDHAALAARIREGLAELTVAPGSHPATEAALLSRLAVTMLFGGHPQEAFALALRAEGVAAEASDPTVFALSQQALGQVLHQVGHLDEAHRRMKRAASVSGADPEIVFHAEVNAASTLRAMGRLDEATDAFAALMARREAVGPIRQTVLLINVASCLNQLRRNDEAQDALDEARRIARRIGRRDLRAWIEVIGSWVATAGGRPESGRLQALDVLLDESVPHVALQGSAARALGEAALRLGEAEQAEAREHIDQVLNRALHEHARQEAFDLHGTMASIAEAQDDLVTAVHHLRASREIQTKLHEDRERLLLAQEGLRLELARMQVEAEALRNHQRELARANSALAASDAARQKLLRTLAHDLRNPLTSLTVLIELLDPQSPEEMLRRKAQIRRTLHRVADLLEQAVQPEEPLLTAPVDISALIRESTQAFEGLAERKQQTLVVDTPAPAPSRTNPESVRRIADNLVSNALKFSPPGSTVRVEVAQDERSVELTVRDQGPGFPKVRADEGMLYGAQLAARSTEGEPSWGIGLHTVYQLASDLGGVVALGNAEQGGALVRVRIPNERPN